MPQLSVAQLVDDNRERLQLSWIAGSSGADKVLDSQGIRESAEGLIGHLNFIHPNWIQILGKPEIAYLDAIGEDACQRTLQHLARSGIACMIMAGSEPAPEALMRMADASRTPLLSSPILSLELMWMLRPYLARALAESMTMHGVFLDVLGVGVLITGESGVGKSELGLELISRGSGLIADDVVELYRIAPETLEGRCPPMLRDFLEVRGLGVLNIRTIFGEAVLRPRKNLRLIVHLEKPGGPESSYVERLPLKPGFEEILGEKVRKVTIPVAAGRNLAVLVEAAVRNYVLQLRGIDSTAELMARQEQLLRREGGGD